MSKINYRYGESQKKKKARGGRRRNSCFLNSNDHCSSTHKADTPTPILALARFSLDVWLYTLIHQPDADTPYVPTYTHTKEYGVDR